MYNNNSQKVKFEKKMYRAEISYKTGYKAG